jgi:hypothetical protein
MSRLLIVGLIAGTLFKPLRPIALLCIGLLVFFHPIKSLLLLLGAGVLRSIFG